VLRPSVHDSSCGDMAEAGHPAFASYGSFVASGRDQAMAEKRRGLFKGLLIGHTGFSQKIKVGPPATPALRSPSPTRLEHCFSCMTIHESSSHVRDGQDEIQRKVRAHGGDMTDKTGFTHLVANIANTAKYRVRSSADCPSDTRWHKA
jgi:hypothetical protein